MSDAAASPRGTRVDLGALWIAPPLIVLAVLFLYPLTLIAHAAVYDSGARRAARDVLRAGRREPDR